MSKILWHSNAPWSITGYGSQTALFAPRLAKEHDVAISAFYGLEGNRLAFGDGITVYPGLARTYGNEVIEAHARDHFEGDLRGGITLSLIDVFVLNPDLWAKFNTVSWVPVDHDPAPPLVKQFFQRTGAIPLAMSEFGRDRLAEFDPLYVPHGVDTSIYKPYDPATAREAVGLPADAFVVGIVAANKGFPPRKSFIESIEAFKQLRQRHSDAVLYLHTEITGANGGVDIPSLLAAADLPDNSVFFADQYRIRHNPLPPEMMARVYSGIDVLLNPSRGEGFGITVLEAQACGTPAIVTDFTAMAEVCGAGWKVEYEREWSGQLSWQARPLVRDILEALNQAYNLPEATREALAAQAVDHAAQYEVGKVTAEHFLPALAAAESRFEARKPAEVTA